MKELLATSTKATIVLLLIAAAKAQNEFQSVPKHRSGGNVGLFPFPRVGRSGDLSWANDYSDLHEMKRQGLMPFPRVGRSEKPRYSQSSVVVPAWILPDVGFQKRNGNGMWFGPRLGRLQKRSFDVDSPWALIALKDPYLGTRQADFTPRLGRESEEEQENDDSVVEEVVSSRRHDTKNRNDVTQQ